MKVTKQDIDALNAVLTVEVSKEDYADKVKSQLNKLRKSAKIPGFRPGTVPASLIQKQYGSSVLADEMNKVVNDALYGYIQENKLNILGNPIPKAGTDVKGDFANPDTFTFEYEIGISPEIKLDLTDKTKIDYNKIKVDDELIGKQLEDIQRRYGKLVASEKVGEKDLIFGKFVELNDDNTVKEGGVENTSTISVEFVEDKATKKSLIGAKVGDVIVVEPVKVSRSEADAAAMLGVKAEEFANLSSKFQMTINEVKVMEMAEMNQELFDKLFGEGAVTTEAEVKERIKGDLDNMFAQDADRLLTKLVFNHLMETTKVELPDTFMKRWIKLSNTSEISEDQIEADYPAYSNNLKWQLIQTEVFKSKDVKFDQAEAVEFTKGLLVANYAQYGIPAPEDAELTQSAMQVLTNKEEANRIYDMLAETKLTQIFKDTVKLNEKEISYDAFVELANK